MSTITVTPRGTTSLGATESVRIEGHPLIKEIRLSEDTTGEFALSGVPRIIFYVKGSNRNCGHDDKQLTANYIEVRERLANEGLDTVTIKNEVSDTGDINKFVVEILHPIDLIPALPALGFDGNAIREIGALFDDMYTRFKTSHPAAGALLDREGTEKMLSAVAHR